MLWIKAFHIIFMVTWMAGIFYLPRLFVYHSITDDQAGKDRFKIMERKLYRGIMTPGMILTITSGLYLWLVYGFNGGWLHTKLMLVSLLVAYHIWCGTTLKRFLNDNNTRSHKFYRVVNEVPVLALVAIVILVVVKPF
jgi:protoporphyrinogen IX oxidase